jgi:formate-dependent phosphoribosylglycinamide formyltransferase (GAR transformylase)
LKKIDQICNLFRSAKDNTPTEITEQEQSAAEAIGVINTERIKELEEEGWRIIAPNGELIKSTKKRGGARNFKNRVVNP